MRSALGSAAPFVASGPISREDVLRMVRASLDSMSADLPICPSTAIKLLQLTRNPNVELREIVALMEEDPVVAAKVLAIAQSTMYARGRRVVNLRDAAVRLGLRELSHVFLEITASVRIFRARGFEAVMNALKRHSIVTAHVSRVVCHHTNVDEPSVFVCALLHDVGAAFAAAAVGTLKNPQQAWPGIIDAHGEVGRMVAEAWDLAPEIATFMATHHGSPFSGPRSKAHCAIVVADWMAARVGMPMPNESNATPPISELRTLGIDELTFDRIHLQAEEVARHVR